MAESDRQTSDSLAAEMAARPFAFDFFQAVRRLEAEYPDQPRVGSSIRLDEDFMRFCQIPSLAFAPSTIESIEQVGGMIRMHVNFLGMFGPNGPLPQHLTDFARDRSEMLMIRPWSDS
jgi:type VI secretion system protein ImpH